MNAKKQIADLVKPVFKLCSRCVPTQKSSGRADQEALLVSEGELTGRPSTLTHVPDRPAPQLRHCGIQETRQRVLQTEAHTAGTHSFPSNQDPHRSKICMHNINVPPPNLVTLTHSSISVSTACHCYFTHWKRILACCNITPSYHFPSGTFNKCASSTQDPEPKRRLKNRN